MPTPAEIAACVPNPAGWGTSIENTAGHNGLCIDGLCRAAEVGDRREPAALTRRLLQGCALLSDVGSPGFIARGVLPNRTSFYPNSSVDQYTYYVYGLWRYYRASFAQQQERYQIRDILEQIASRLVSNDYAIPREDGDPNVVYCDFGEIQLDRSSRALEMLLAAYDVCEDERWYDEYLRLALDEDGARLRNVDRDHSTRWAVWVLQQTQVSLRLLYEAEQDQRRKETYRRSLQDIAKRVEPALSGRRKLDIDALREKPDFDWRTAFHTLGIIPESREDVRRFLSHLHQTGQRRLRYEANHIAEPLAAAMIILFSEDEDLIHSNAQPIAELLTEVPFELCLLVGSLCTAHEVYQWGIQRELW
jgi:hypothetical protein